MAPRPDAATGLLLELYRDRDTDAAARVMFRAIEPHLKRLYPATFDYNDGKGNTTTLPLFGELVEAAFYYSDRAEEEDSLPKQTPKFAPGANGAIIGGNFGVLQFAGRGLQPALPRRVQDRVRDRDGVAAAAP